MLDAARSAVHEFSADSGAGRINLDTAAVSRMNTEKPQRKIGGWRVGSRVGNSSSTPPKGAKQS